MNFIEYTVKVYSNGTKKWFLNGKFHREDGPAIEFSNGNKEWLVNGKRHREDDANRCDTLTIPRTKPCEYDKSRL